PATGSPRLINVTGESLSYSQETQRSRTLDPNRQVTGLVRTNVSTSGGVDFEWRYGDLDALLEAALQSDATWTDFADIASVTVTFELLGGLPAITFSSSGVIANIQAGDWIRMSGAGINVANRRLFRVLSKSSASVILNGPSSIIVAEASVVGTCEIGQRISNGSTQKSYSIEKYDTQIPTARKIFTGQLPNTLSVNGSLGGVGVTGSMGFIGSTVTTINTDTPMGNAAYSSASSNPIFNSVDPNSGLYRNNERVECAQSISIDVSNNLRAEGELFRLGAKSILSGKFEVSGSVALLKEDNDYIDEFVAFQDSNLSLVLQDTSGRVLIFDIPRVTWSSYEDPASGENESIVETVGFQAQRHGVENRTLRLVRFA
ncbi:MAG: phage tail tube protein, partial [Kofleriaceae bacterium]